MPGRTKRPSNAPTNVANRLADRPVVQLGFAMVLAAAVSILLFGYGALRNQSLEYEYLIWNLFLAGLPLMFALMLLKVLPNRPWTDWQPLALTVLWLGFLPNSFYLISDYIHLQDIVRIDILYDVVMFSSFIFNGVTLGFLSLLLIHRELRHRATPQVAGWIVTLILLACSYAIFLGRDLRWNTWDIIFNPAGILFDVSDRFIRFGQDSQMVLTTAVFFMLLGSSYLILWRGLIAAKALKQR